MSFHKPNLTVTQRIKMISQPAKGYVPKQLFLQEQYRDDYLLMKIETGLFPIQGMAVDYLTRFILSGDRDASFHVSILGALALDEAFENNEATYKLRSILSHVKGLDDESIIYACKAVGYDSAFRAGIGAFQNVDSIQTPPALIHNIRVLVNRSVHFLRDVVGPVVRFEVTFEGGYTDIIGKGDGDFLTRDTLVDLKVSVLNLQKDWRLQILIYYLLGIHSVHREFQSVTKLCIYNPFTNRSLTVRIDDISDQNKYIVSHEVIGYKMVHPCNYMNEKGQMTVDYSHWREVDGTDPDIVDAFYNRERLTTFDEAAYGDGIHIINTDEYWSYLKKNVPGYEFSFRPKFKYTSYVLMIKRNGFRMFLSMSYTGKYSILQGAALKKASFSPEYYYNNLEKYANAVIARFSPYWDVLDKISEQVQALEPNENFLRGMYMKYRKEQKSFGRSPVSFDSWYRVQGDTLKC